MTPPPNQGMISKLLLTFLDMNKTTKPAAKGQPQLMPNLNPSFYEKDVMYGMTTMGPRGQIVIPSEARKDMGIEAGDRLLVVGKFGKIISMIKAEDIEGMVSMMMDHVNKNTDDKPFKEHMKKQLTELRKFTGSTKIGKIGKSAKPSR